MNSELRIVDAPYFSSTWVGIAMLSRRAWCARALLALVTAMALLAGLTLVTLLALLAGLPLRTLLAGLTLVTLIALLAGLPLHTLLTLLAGLPLRTLLSRGPWERSCACVATTDKYGQEH
jgi:hypothetical protein